CQNSGVKGRDLVFTLPFFQKATMKTRGLTIKIRANKLNNVGSCENSVSPELEAKLARIAAENNSGEACSVSHARCTRAIISGV
ncbi:MAG TPA: hypothetical protein VGP19_05915, partial [Candidatus Acidoferrales bacterium]|nr:hypothetical protein [Candidatus Acidoferrales bacterium]